MSGKILKILSCHPNSKFWLAVFLLIFSRSLSSYTITRHDKELIAPLFLELFSRHELGYTLFGEKPMSVCHPATYPPKFSKKRGRFLLWIDVTVPLFRSYKKWQEIGSKVSISNYLFSIYEENQYPTYSLLVNKKAFSEVFEKNKDLFQRYYGRSITIQDLFQKLNVNKLEILVNQPLFQQPVLLGLALGYGRSAAEDFHRREKLTEISCCLMHPKACSFIQEELDDLWLYLDGGLDNFDWFSVTVPFALRVNTVRFAYASVDSEAQRLVNIYKHNHYRLTEILAQDDWLDHILGKLFEAQEL